VTRDQQRQTQPSILIILMGSLGDVARGLGLVGHLKSNLPDCRITWLVEPKCTPLVRLHPLIDQIIVFHRAWRPAAISNLYQQLRQCQFDITFDLQRHLKSGIFSWLSKSPRRIGFHRSNTKEMNWVFNNEHIDFFKDDLPKIEHYFKFTEHLGFPPPAGIDFGLVNLDLNDSATKIGTTLKNPYVAVLMGSRWESKNWFVQGYLRLAKEILSMASFRVVLVGDQSQTAAAAEIMRKIASPDLIDLTGQTSLLDLIFALKNAAAAVGPDSGPGHVAAALGTPYVTLFGPTSPKRTAPYGCEQLVVQAELKCVPCYQKQCPENSRQCMHMIRVESIMERLRKALG
jgi:lipopolysaccharide heptosyltransferase II